MDLPTFPTLQLAQAADHVLLVTLNRPEALNALNTQMAADLQALFLELTARPQGVRCIVLTGAGGKAFCAGGDLKQRDGMTPAQWQAQHEQFERGFVAIMECPLPVIAALNGLAYGGGLEMGLCCDFIYASSTARFALPEVKLGIIPGGCGTQNFARAVGERRAREVLLTGRAFTAAEGAAWGAFNELFEPDQVLPAALAAAQAIADNAPLAVLQAKKSVRYGMQMDLLTAYRFEIEAYNRLVDTEDRREGVRAFNEKRKPQFQGR